MSEVLEVNSATAGALLRQAREASGTHIEALAVALKVPVAKLKALEADKYDLLPDMVFVRALASSVCRTLKMNPAPVLALLPLSANPRLYADSAGLNAPVKTSSGRLSSSPGSFSSRTASRSVFFVVVALLAGALAVFLFPRQQEKHSSGVMEPASPLSDPVDGISSSPVLAASAPVVLTMPPSANSDIPATVGAAVGSAVPPSGAAGGGVAGDKGTAATGTLVLRARGQSWVQVRDASGVAVLQRNLAANESVSVNASPPLAVVVGRADATEVFIRGERFDLAGVSRENVARFEVK